MIETITLLHQYANSYVSFIQTTTTIRMIEEILRDVRANELAKPIVIKR